MELVILADQPELVALGTLASVAPTKMAAGFNDPESLFAHLDLEEIERIRGACDRLGALTIALAESMRIYLDAAKAVQGEAVEASGAD